MPTSTIGPKTESPAVARAKWGQRFVRPPSVIRRSTGFARVAQFDHVAECARSAEFARVAAVDQVATGSWVQPQRGGSPVVANLGEVSIGSSGRTLRAS